MENLMNFLFGFAAAALGMSCGLASAHAALDPVPATSALFRTADLRGIDPTTRHGHRLLKRRIALLVRQDCARIPDRPAFGPSYGPGKIPFAAPETARAKCIREGRRAATAYRKSLAVSAANLPRGA
jgi:hypothetical protein